MMTASADALSEAMMLFSKRFRNSSRAVDISLIVSGDRPTDRQPFQSGVKSTQGMTCACVTSTATLNEVVKVQ
jgi:hypothetical protein